ncbi:DUF4123 domain-containing protein [Loktanella sp. F6476L]|uniref:DUF4123 domain-containing protein n=1 Tax=Loktanella sp. F6476L TaxID=2926405 RepID=UPI001FF136BC|nr:DUF4123 domain-containing protein [Loktanella sp. F6476L]MCK0122436.1 DUF4123 domain-containing protein [Loktanella sp. F6476L]
MIFQEATPFNSTEILGPNQAIPKGIQRHLQWDGSNKSRVFALLDASLIQGLPEVLQGTGLQNACLFQGDAEQELGDAAPWLVQLDLRSEFTRQIFTVGSEPWSYWSRSPLVLESNYTFRKMLKNLRRYTRIRDTQGKWFYFRFWDPTTVKSIFETPEMRHLQGLYGANKILMPAGEYAWITDSEGVEARGPSVVLTPEIWAALQRTKSIQILNKLVIQIKTDEPNPFGWSDGRILEVARAWYNASVADENALVALTVGCMRSNLAPVAYADLHTDIWQNEMIPTTKKARLMLKATPEATA